MPGWEPTQSPVFDWQSDTNSITGVASTRKRATFVQSFIAVSFRARGEQRVFPRARASARPAQRDVNEVALHREQESLGLRASETP